MENVTFCFNKELIMWSIFIFFNHGNVADRPYVWRPHLLELLIETIELSTNFLKKKRRDQVTQ